MQAVKQDLDGSVVLTSSEFFLQHILGINDSKDLPRPLEDVISQNYSERRRRWRDLPTDENVESKFYEPFVRLANEIADKTVQAFPHDKHTIRGKWLDCHSISPTKTTDSVADIRPDCAFVPNADVALRLRQEYSSLKENMAAGLDDDKERVEKVRQLWWSQIVVAVEMKRAKKANPSDQNAQYRGALPQLCGYIRQVFRQQLDRRFALGITLSFNNIAVWLCDRSGVLGMTQVSNIHSEPRTFVRIISAISRLPSYRLGYDPTMQLYEASLRKFQFSHQIRQAPPQLTESKWMLTVTDNRDSNNLHQPVIRQVILDGPPLLARSAEVMNGRAVQVHQGYLKEDSEKFYRSPLVIKTSWQPLTKIKTEGPLVSFEAYFYGLISAFKDRVLAASVVMTNHGWGDTHDSVDGAIAVSTMSYVRKCAQADINTAKEINHKIEESLSRKEDLDERKEPLAFLAFGNATTVSSDHLYFAQDPSGLADRLQTRIVLNVWGYPLKFFTCREELLQNIRDTIRDHLEMLKACVLHRDLSDGNIIMQPMKPESGVDIYNLVSRTTGRLIDLDHAKGTEKKKTVGNFVPSSGMVLRQTRSLNSEDYNIPVTEDAVARGLTFLRPMELGIYCNAAIQFDIMKSKSDEGDWTAEDLGWEDVEPQPDFDSHAPDVVKRTGTIPFISHRLMRIYPEAHNGIHDMESLFWVLIHICLIRESGGGNRRTDLSEGSKKRKEYNNLITRLFYSNQDLIGPSKQIYFDIDSGERFEDLLTYVHDYFDSFKDLLRRWRNVLVLGYTFKAYEYYRVHHYILKIIDDTLRLSAVQNEDRDTPVIQQELAQRAKDYKFICMISDTQDGNTSSINAVPPVPPPSLSSPASRVQVPQPAPRFRQAAPNRVSAPSSNTTPTAATNHPYPSVPTPAPTPNRLPTSFPPSPSSSNRPVSNVVSGSVPAAPSPGCATPSAVPRQTHTSPKMHIPKKARKE